MTCTSTMRRWLTYKRSRRPNRRVPTVSKRLSIPSRSRHLSSSPSLRRCINRRKRCSKSFKRKCLRTLGLRALFNNLQPRLKARPVAVAAAARSSRASRKSVMSLRCCPQTYRLLIYRRLRSWKIQGSRPQTKLGRTTVQLMKREEN